MVNTYTLQEDFPTPHSAIRKSLRGSWNWKSCGAVFGLCSGLIFPILALILTVISWFSDPAWHGFFLHTAATSLFVVAFPLLIFGAHCLDLLDSQNERASAHLRLTSEPNTWTKEGDGDDVEGN